MNSKSPPYNDKEINDLKTYLMKIDIPIEKISKNLEIKEVSNQISEQYEKTISPGQAEAVLLRVMGFTLSSKQRTQIYDLRKKIQRYEKFLTNFREWGNKPDHELKVIILGLMEEQSDYLTQTFNKPNIALERDIIGVNFLTKFTEIYDILVRLQIWDVTSQDRFAFLRPQFYKGATAAILVFNKEDRKSFDMLKIYYDELKESTGLKFKTKRKLRKEISIPIAVIALGNNTVIPYEEILSLTREIGALYFEIGNIEDERFQETLDLIATTVLVKFQG
ncbi:MAG: hypothetical protein KGD70_01585 [Candidatus Lokiarchaeota archaeon]|nr:hypothetical protein [Candidatus Lokiarchaeota archaeon]